jgi:hypothetical protein
MACSSTKELNLSCTLILSITRPITFALYRLGWNMVFERSIYASMQLAIDISSLPSMIASRLRAVSTTFLRLPVCLPSGTSPTDKVKVVAWFGRIFGIDLLHKLAQQ